MKFMLYYLWTDVQSGHSSTPRLIDAHDGAGAPQSAHMDMGWDSMGLAVPGAVPRDLEEEPR